MTKKPADTPSGVLKDTLLEYSRQQRHRHRHHHRPRHPPIESRQERTESDQALDFQTDHPEQQEGEGPPIRSELPSLGGSAESLKPPADEDEDTLRHSATTGADDSIKSRGATQPLYRQKDETSIDSLIIEEMRRKSCTCASACCSSTEKYFVPPELRDGDKPIQTKFIQKVFTMILLKAVLLVCWLTVVESCAEVRSIYTQLSYYHFFGLGTYLSIKLILRLGKNFRYCKCYVLLFIYLLDMAAIADFLGYLVSQFIGCYSVPRKVLYTIIGLCIFFIFVGFFMTFDMADGIMIAAALVVCFMVGVEQVLHMEFGRTYNDMQHPPKILNQILRAAVALAVSELITTIIIVELKSVLTGRRFSPRTYDWFFTSFYVI